MLTDFPADGSKVKILGPRQYYLSLLDCEEAASTLRIAGARSEHNSYLPRNSVVEFESVRPFSHARWVEVIGRLGEWCHFEPT